MKKFLIFTLYIVSAFSLMGQNPEEVKTGSVSFISSQNVYVQFVNTDGIHIGDTLFILKDNNKLQPALAVNSLSSISCVGTIINGAQLKLTNKLVAKIKLEIPIEVITEKTNESLAVNDLALKNSKSKDTTTINKERIDGRISVSSYSNFSTNAMSLTTPNYRLRYNLAFNAEHIANSKFSFENYMSFTHTFNNPLALKDLKIYNLALNYNIDSTSTVSFGRKINVNTANIGAVDGFQFEKRIKDLTFGVLIGSRPNDSTYSFDGNLFQYGAYVSHNFEGELANAQTSIGFFNQTNKLKTDRRYIYLQHSNSLLKNVDLFGSAEIDLFNGIKSSVNLTSAYLSLSYRPAKIISLTLSYDARKNIYYYETYKNKIDSTLEKETRQGLRFRFNFRPFKYFSWGGNAGYRLQSPTSHESLNAISYLSFSKLPLIDASLTLTGTALKTANISGFIYGGSMSKDFIDGKLSAEIEYRKALIFAQDIAEISLFYHLSKNLMLSADFEGTLEQGEFATRVFINISKRF
jgi:hypothetical protein